jgi:hypothetical protein
LPRLSVGIELTGFPRLSTAARERLPSSEKLALYWSTEYQGPSPVVVLRPPHKGRWLIESRTLGIWKSVRLASSRKSASAPATSEPQSKRVE